MKDGTDMRTYQMNAALAALLLATSAMPKRVAPQPWQPQPLQRPPLRLQAPQCGPS